MDVELTVLAKEMKRMVAHIKASRWPEALEAIGEVEFVVSRVKELVTREQFLVKMRTHKDKTR